MRFVGLSDDIIGVQLEDTHYDFFIKTFCSGVRANDGYSAELLSGENHNGRPLVRSKVEFSSRKMAIKQGEHMLVGYLDKKLSEARKQYYKND